MTISSLSCSPREKSTSLLYNRWIPLGVLNGFLSSVFLHLINSSMAGRMNISAKLKSNLQGGESFNCLIFIIEFISYITAVFTTHYICLQLFVLNNSLASGCIYHTNCICLQHFHPLRTCQWAVFTMQIVYAYSTYLATD